MSTGDGELPEARQRSPRDHAQELGIAAINGLPFVGGVIAQLIDAYRPHVLRVWCEAVERQFEALPDEIAEKIFHDDRFMSSFHRATTMATATHLTDRAEMLAAGLYELAQNPEDWQDEVVARMFLMIERLTPLHLQAMRHMNATERLSSVHSDPIQSALQVLRNPRLGVVAPDDPMKQIAVARDLVELNLVDRKAADGTIVFGGVSSTPSWYQRSVLSAEGQYFLKFLHYFATAEEEE